jgi:sulfite oxidase
MASIKPVQGILWESGVIANVKWGGVRLCDILRQLGVNSDPSLQVCFESNATLCQDDSYYGASIPLSKALSPDDDVLLAFDVNLNFNEYQQRPSSNFFLAFR